MIALIKLFSFNIVWKNAQSVMHFQIILDAIFVLFKMIIIILIQQELVFIQKKIIQLNIIYTMIVKRIIIQNILIIIAMRVAQKYMEKSIQIMKISALHAQMRKNFFLIMDALIIVI